MSRRADRQQRFYQWTRKHIPTNFEKIAAVSMACGVIAISAASAQTFVQADVTPLEARAAKYIEFRNDVQIVDATPIDNAGVTRDAHNRLGSHTAEDLSSGFIAYAALVAADTPAFVESIQARVAQDREGFLAELRSTPGSVWNLSGAYAAEDAIKMMAAQDATYVEGLGQRYISEAYAMQNKGWAKRALSTDGPSRLYEAENYSYSRSRMATPVLPATTANGVRTPGLNSYDRMWAANWGTSNATPLTNDRARPIITRALVLAARYSVGDLTDSIVNGYAKSENTRRCYYSAKLNLDQCISATRTSTEEVFCIGKHGLGEVSSCVGWIANAGAR
ncbi:MAG: hypothetical protein MRY72_06765 [Aquisalinus sp.]|nr:hypothetical protein [Aquisalinus sp.]